MPEPILKKPVKPVNTAGTATTSSVKAVPKKKVWSHIDLVKAQRNIKRLVTQQTPSHKPVVPPSVTAAQIKREG